MLSTRIGMCFTAFSVPVIVSQMKQFMGNVWPGSGKRASFENLASKAWGATGVLMLFPSSHKHHRCFRKPMAVLVLSQFVSDASVCLQFVGSVIAVTSVVCKRRALTIWGAILVIPHTLHFFSSYRPNGIK